MSVGSAQDATDSTGVPSARAIQRADWKRAQLLLDAQPELNVRDRYGLTHLTAAIAAQNVDSSQSSFQLGRALIFRQHTSNHSRPPPELLKIQV